MQPTRLAKHRVHILRRLSAPFAVLCLGLLSPVAVRAASQTRTASFEYDPASGLLLKDIVEPDDSSLCRVTTYRYDAYGNKVESTTRACNGGSGEAPAPKGNAGFAPRTSSLAYTADAAAISGAAYDYPEGQFPTTATSALNQRETRTYDARFGTVASFTDPNGLTTSWQFDGFGRKTLEKRPDGTSTTWTYELCKDVLGGTAACPSSAVLVEITVPSGSARTKTYTDSLHRTVRVETEGIDDRSIRKDTEYDSLGRVARSSLPYFANAAPAWTVYSYDLLGRVTAETSPATAAGTRVTSTKYNGLTITASVNTAPAQTKTITRNSQGQVVQVIDTAGSRVTYTYDPFGNLTQTNAGGVLTELTYDLLGRKVGMVDPDMGSWRYAYNGLGELVSQTDAKGQSTTFVYDLLGRMTKRTEPGLITNWYFDTYTDGAACPGGIGGLCQVECDNGYVRKLSYDRLGRIATLSTTIDKTYAVDTTYVTSGPHAGKIDSIRYPTGFAIKYGYNPTGYLTEVRKADDSSLLWRVTAQNAAGQALGEVLGNNLVTARTYDALYRLTSVTSGTAASKLVEMSFSYDLIGNLIRRIDATQGVTENFAYDSLNRLIQSSGPNLATSTFAYDAIGNLVNKSDVGVYNYPSVGASRPHAVTRIKGSRAAAYSYDDNGGLISTVYENGDIRSLDYSAFGLPTTVRGKAGGQAYQYQYTYNAEHERIKLTTTRTDGTYTSIYLHPSGHGMLLYEEERQPGEVSEHKHYIQAGSELIGVYVTKSKYVGSEQPEMRYYHRDHLGSIAAVTNPSGAMIERFSYEPFGQRRFPKGGSDPNNTIIGVTTDRGFTGHEHLDELSLIHMNGRIYDPVLGRFMTPDPFLQAPENLQSYNRYSYVMNNPLGYVDPTGYSWLSRALGAIWRSEIVQAVVTIGIAYVAGPGAAAAYTGLRTTVNTHSIEEGIKAGAISYFTALAFNAVGDIAPSGVGNIAGHAAVGCLSAEASGGDCGPGALSAGVTAAWTQSGIQFDSFGANLTVQSTVGGIAAELSGGSFAQGAVTGAFGYLFNYCSHGSCTTDLEQTLYDWLPGYKAGTLLYNQTMGDGSWTGWEVLDFASVAGNVAGKGFSLLGTASREVTVVDGYVQNSTFKFKHWYHDKLWKEGRPYPFLQAQEVLDTATSVSKDRMKGFYRYTNGRLEMVYNPKTREIFHLQPLSKSQRQFLN